MADDDWQLQAVHEQFDVFESLFEPCSSFAATDLSTIIEKVDAVIKRQLRMKSNKTISSREISLALIKAVPKEENKIFISYAVVVTNEGTNDNLCKFPVFRVQVGNQHTFVDLGGSAYKSWNTFMKSNDMPACKFCYPVNGCYDVKGKLKVDFALSPARSLSQRPIWYLVGGLAVSGAVVAATFFFKIPPVVFKFADSLIPFAEKWLPKIISNAMKHILNLAKLNQLYRNGNILITDFTFGVFKFLCSAYATFKDEIDHVWKETKRVMYAVYNYLNNKFTKYFEIASNESKHNFVANVVRVEEEMSQVEEEAGAQLNEMNRSLRNNKSPISTLGSIMVYDSSYNRQIFQSCRSDSALLQEIKRCNNESDKCTQLQIFKPTTESLLTLSQTASNQLGVTTLSDVKDIFESLCCIVKDEYKNKVDNYIKGVYAASAAARHEMNLDVYNKSLGIVGDPKDHFMKEAMKSTQETRLAYRLKEKIKEIQMDSKIFLIPIYKMSEDDDIGVYKSLGVRGTGKFSAQWLLKVLKESLSDLDERSLVVNETNSVIYIRSEDISIFAYQEVNEENTSEGLVYVNKQV